MSIFSEYIRSKVGQFLMVIICLFSSGTVLFLSGTHIQNILLVDIMILVLYGIYFRCQYLRYKKEYQAVQKISMELDTRYLAHELLKKPEEIEGKMYFDLLKLANHDMCNRVAENKWKLDESKELIEEWIHELKTPLTSLELMKNSSDKSDISYEVERMKYTLDQCLNYIRMDTLEKDYHVENICLCDFLHELIMEERNAIREKGLAVEIQILQNQEVTSDRKWIGFIFKQLINNAIKYNSREGSILFTYRKEKGLIYIGVKDTGCGIAPEDLARIWEKGFTGHGINRDAASGIGLYLVKKCADRMNLKLLVNSVLEEGSVFEVGFPDSL